MAFRSTRLRAKKPLGPAAEPQSMFTVLKSVAAGSEDGKYASPRVSVRGFHPTEEQAYTAAIVELIYDLEEPERAPQTKLRAIAKTATLPLKERLKSLQACQDSEERVEFVIKKANAFPEEEKMKDMEALLEGPLLPCSYWDSSDEEDYDPNDEEEGEDDEDDDMEDLVNEEETMQGIEGSGAKIEGSGAKIEGSGAEGEEEDKAEDENKPE